MKSTMSGSTPFGQLPLSEIELLTSAILPVVALMFVSPAMFGETGSDAPFAPPEASETRKYSPGAIVPPSGCLLVQLVPAAEAYCKDQPARLNEIPVGLRSEERRVGK